VAAARPPLRRKGVSDVIFDQRRDRSERRSTRLRPRLEALEGRVVLSTFRVSTTLDPVDVNLRTGEGASGRISLPSAIMPADDREGKTIGVLRTTRPAI
jgi:hypothetical protein